MDVVWNHDTTAIVVATTTTKEIKQQQRQHQHPQEEDQLTQQPDWEKFRGKLYDRRHQEEELFQAIKRRTTIATNNTESFPHELILITGASGTGKTCLANTVRAYLENDRDGYFISGKFDLLPRPEPYGPFVQAFSQFARFVQERGRVAQLQQAIGQTMKESMTSWAVLTEMIPPLEPLIGVADPATAAPSSDPSYNTSMDGKELQQTGGHNHFLHLFCKFVQSIRYHDRL